MSDEADLTRDEELVEAPRQERRRRRWLRRLLLALLVVALGVGLAAFVLLVHPTGLRSVLDRLGPWLGGELTYESAEGRLLDAWSVDGLRFRQTEDGEPTGLEIEVGRLSVRWRATALTSGLVDIVSVEAGQVEITTPPAAADEAPFELPDVRLPVTLQVDAARVTDLAIVAGAEQAPIRIDRIDLRRLAAAPAGGPASIERLAIAAGASSVELAGTLRPVGDYPLDLDLTWRVSVPLAEGEPSLRAAGAGTVRGSLASRIELDQQLSARSEASDPEAPSPIVGTVAARVSDPLGAPRVEGEVAWSRLRWPLEGDEILFESEGRAQVAGDLERLEIDGTVAARGPQVPESELALRAVTDLESLVAESLELRTLGSTVTGSGTVAWRDGVTWSAQLEGRDLDPAVKWPEWPGSLALGFDGSGSVDENGLARTEATLDRIRGSLRGYPVDASGEVLVVGRQLETLLLEGRSGTATARLSGSIRERADVDFVATIPDLSEVLPEAGGVLEAQGRLFGDRDAPALKVEVSASDIVWRSLRVASLTSSAEGVVAAGGELHADLEVEDLVGEELDARDATFRIDGTLGGLDVAGLWQSTVDAQLTASELRVGTVRASGVTLEVDGTLAEHTLALSADSAEQEGGQQAAQRVSVRAAGGATEASVDGRWSGALQELRLFAPGFGRWALDSEVSVDLSRDQVEVGQGCWRRDDSPAFETSSVCGEARWSRVEPWSLRAEISDLPLGLLDPLLASLVEGEPVDCPPGADGSAGCVESSVTAEPGPLRALELDGRLGARVEASGVGLAVERGSAEITRLEGNARAVLSSGEPLDVPFRTTAGSIRLDAERGATGSLRLELPDNEGSVQARFELPGYAPSPERWTPADDQRLTGSLDAELRDATFLEVFVPQLREPKGLAEAALRLSGTAAAPSLEGSVRLTDGSARLAFDNPSAPGEELTLTLERTEVDARFERTGLAVTLSLRTTDPAGDARGTIELPGYRLFADRSLDEQPLRGRVELALDEITPVAELLPQLAAVSGVVDGSFSLAGTIGAPELDGRADLRGFSATIPDLGVELREGTATVRGTPGGDLEITASVQSGPGKLNATGTVTAESGGWTTALELEGSDLTVADLPDVRVRASPDLTVLATGEAIDVRGEVLLPWARITLRDLPDQAIEPSSDIVRVDRPPEEVAATGPAGPRITGRIRLVLGDDIDFEGFGFDVEPTGSLLITETGRGSTTATGQLNLGEGGRYRAYGQRLEITSGRMLFGGGPIQNPALAVEAYRTVGTVQAGVRVSGNLMQPIVRLTSTPAMPEGDILHYMILGRPPGKITTEDEADLLANAALALGIGGGNLLARKLASRYELDQLGIETNGDLDSASLVVGKYLSPRLYVSYGIGLLEPISTITLRYLLSSKWTLLAEKGRGTGADLVYTIETGKRRVSDTAPP